MKYRKKPVVIDAVQWDGTYAGLEMIKSVYPEIETARLHNHAVYGLQWEIKTLEGRHTVSTMDFVIKGVKGEFYPCKPDIFKMTYDPVC